MVNYFLEKRKSKILLFFPSLSVQSLILMRVDFGDGRLVAWPRLGHIASR